MKWECNEIKINSELNRIEEYQYEIFSAVMKKKQQKKLIMTFTSLIRIKFIEPDNIKRNIIQFL